MLGWYSFIPVFNIFLHRKLTQLINSNKQSRLHPAREAFLESDTDKYVKWEVTKEGQNNVSKRIRARAQKECIPMCFDAIGRKWGLGGLELRTYTRCPSHAARITAAWPRARHTSTFLCQVCLI